MKRRASLRFAAMDLHVTVTGRRDLAEQICTQIRRDIRTGVLRDTEALPSTRELAARIGVSRTTVTAAYERLATEGLIVARPGVGTFPRPADRGYARIDPPAESLVPQPVWEDVWAPEGSLFSSRAEVSFHAGQPWVADFPFARWRALLSAQFRARTTWTSDYPDPGGVAELREAIARHIAVSRAVHADAADIVVTIGIQQAVDIIVRTMSAPGDCVAVEDPGYPAIHALLRSHRLRVCSVPVDAEGLVVERLPDEARLVYVTPSHQFPLGVTMSARRRRELLDWAGRVGAVIVEDDYDSEFRFGGRPLAPLRAIDDSGLVVYVGSFSKTLLPTLRIGFLVAPPAIARAARKVKFVSDFGSPGPIQAALAEFIRSGDFATYVRHMRREYEGRHHLVRQLLHDEFGGVLEPIDSMAGLHLAAGVGPEARLTDREMSRAARRAGIQITALSRLSVTKVHPVQGLLFGYGPVSVERIPDAMRRLRQVM